MRVLFPAVLIVLLMVTSCTTHDKSGQRLDTTTSGSITIAVDESLKPLLDAEADTFEALYDRAHVDIIYTSEENAINLLLTDSVRIAVITRKLIRHEDSLFKKKLLDPSQVVVAKEGIGLIVNKNNPDSVISMEQIYGILTGKITKWNQLNPKSSSANIELVFDQPTSGIVRYLKDSLRIDKLPPNCFAVNGNPAVVDHIAANKQAIGLIGVSWISDADDSTTNVFLNTVSVVAVSDTTGGESYQPYQAYIAQRQYPLIRNITVINPEGRAGLGSGFLAFIAGEKGQRIILKAGLVPVTMPIRIVEIKRAPL